MTISLDALLAQNIDVIDPFQLRALIDDGKDLNIDVSDAEEILDHILTRKDAAAELEAALNAHTMSPAELQTAIQNARDVEQRPGKPLPNEILKTASQQYM